MKRKLALLLTAALVAGALGACAKTSSGGGDGSAASDTGSGDAVAAVSNEGEMAEDGTPIISFFDKNSGTRTFDDPIAQELMKRTGVTINLISPTGDPAEKLSLMLAGQDYPDIVLMDRGSDIVNQYIEAGALVDLSQYLDKLPNVAKMYGETLNKTRYTDGDNYYLSNWYGYDPDPVNGFIMRYDIMIDLVGQERADSDEPFTFSEMVELLKQFKEKYPQMNGADSVALVAAEPGTSDNLNGVFAGMYGMKTYYVDDNGDLHYRVSHPEYLDAIHDMNLLYREGLLDKEWTSNNEELRNQKLSQGNVFGYIGAYWDPWTPSAALKQSDNENAEYLAYKVVADGHDADQTTLSGRSSLGWDAIAITKNCKNLDAALAFVDYCASQEGQDLLLWGIEGQDWEFVDGVRTPIGDIVQRYKADPTNVVNDTGITKWTWFVKNDRHEDDDTTNRIFWNEQDRSAQFAYKNITNAYWDTAEFDNLVPAGNSTEALKAQKVQDIINQAYPNMVNAATQEECDAVYQQMMTDLEQAGIADVEAAMTQSYKDRMELWGMN
ncbi:MAG: extracellular solute-binding protein [Eubacteriales bacterium]|nr:extracellular solute-binding protein [Eubacteriales bacterium]